MLKVYRGLPFILVGLTTISIISLSAGSVSADDSVVDQVIISVSSSCTMSSSGENSHTATVPNNTTRSDIGTTTVNAFCNDSGGFAIYAIGYTDETYGKTVLASATLGSTKDIATGTATSGSTSNWAMKLTNTGTTYPLTIQNSFNSYHSVPNAYTLVASRTSGTAVGTGATGATFTTTYRAFISSTQPADTYTGKVKYTMVHPSNAGAPAIPLAESDCPAYNICYSTNASDIVGAMISTTDAPTLTSIASNAQAGKQTQTVDDSDTAIEISGNSTTTLIAPNYSREGYGFAGWSTDFNATNSSIIYGPNETISTNPNDDYGVDVSSHGVILYPVWVASVGTMQTWNGCSSLTTAPAPNVWDVTGRPTLANITALTDARDDNVYTVARLSDGKCWMTENLRLNAEATRGDDNKALAQGYYTYPGSGTDYGSFVGLADSENTSFLNANANSIYYSGTQSGTASMNINTSNNPSHRLPRYNSNNTNRNLTPSYNANDNADYYQWFSYGNYYGWAAAIASTDHYPSINKSETSTSICPSGWRLPQGGNKNRIVNYGDSDFWTLIVVNINGGTNPADYNSSVYPSYMKNSEGPVVSKLVRMFPNNYIYSGRWEEAQPTYRSLGGYYRTSTVYSTGYAYNLDILNSTVRPASTWGTPKTIGISVRCVKDVGAQYNV